MNPQGPTSRNDNGTDQAASSPAPGAAPTGSAPLWPEERPTAGAPAADSGFGAPPAAPEPTRSAAPPVPPIIGAEMAATAIAAPVQAHPVPSGPGPNGYAPGGPVPGAPVPGGPVSGGPVPGGPFSGGPPPAMPAPPAGPSAAPPPGVSRRDALRGQAASHGQQAGTPPKQRSGPRLRLLAAASAWALVLSLGGIAVGVWALITLIAGAASWFEPVIVVVGLVGMAFTVGAFPLLERRGIPWALLGLGTVTLIVGASLTSAA